MRAHDLFELPLSFRDRFLLTCAPDPPPPPDYRGAAEAQGAANVDAARAQGRINNPNVYSPYGNQTVRWDGDTPTLIQTLAPDQQRLLDRSNQTSLALSDLALEGANRARGVIGTNVDFSGLPNEGASSRDARTGVMRDMGASLTPMPDQAGDIRGRVVNAMMARVNEDVDRQKGLTESNLIAAGIPKGSKAYDDAMALQERTRTDAANQAYLAGGQEMSRDFGVNMARRQQGVSEFGQAANIGAQGSQMDSNLRRNALAELLTRRQTPLNEIAALRSGSQVANPFSMPGYAQNAQVAPAPVFAATQAAGDYATDVYNARAAQAGGLQAGLFGLGNAALGAGTTAMLMRSDRRLKSNIVRLGDHPLGIGWYSYDIDGNREQGVMADEVLAVKPDAVVIGDDGYMLVDYAQVGRL